MSDGITAVLRYGLAKPVKAGSMALSALRVKLQRHGMFSACEMAQHLGVTDDATAYAVVRMLPTFSHIEPKTVGAGVNPDSLWGFI